MARVTDRNSAEACAVCERSLLLGENTTRYKPAGEDWMQVCALCRVPARELGWVKEGAPSSPVVPLGKRRLRMPRMKRADGAVPAVAPAAGTRRDATQIDCFAAACGTFNESAFRRTVSGIAKSLGDPSANLVYLTGAKPEVVITVAWDLSWYQYRVVISETPSIRLAERGYEIDELDSRFREENASFDSEMELAPFKHATAAGGGASLS